MSAVETPVEKWPGAVREVTLGTATPAARAAPP